MVQLHWTLNFLSLCSPHGRKSSKIQASEYIWQLCRTLSVGLGLHIHWEDIPVSSSDGLMVFIGETLPWFICSWTNQLQHKGYFGLFRIRTGCSAEKRWSITNKWYSTCTCGFPWEIGSWFNFTATRRKSSKCLLGNRKISRIILLKITLVQPTTLQRAIWNRG